MTQHTFGVLGNATLIFDQGSIDPAFGRGNAFQLHWKAKNRGKEKSPLFKDIGPETK